VPVPVAVEALHPAPNQKQYASPYAELPQFERAPESQQSLPQQTSKAPA
jgi:hypothetical protein